MIGKNLKSEKVSFVLPHGTQVHTAQLRESFIRFYANFASETFAFLLINNLYLTYLELLNCE